MNGQINIRDINIVGSPSFALKASEESITLPQNLMKERRSSYRIEPLKQGIVIKKNFLKTPITASRLFTPVYASTMPHVAVDSSQWLLYPKQEIVIMDFDRSLISISPNFRNGVPCIAGTGVSVHRIVGWYQMGMLLEEISMQYNHINLTQINAALAYYYANREEIDGIIAVEDQLANEFATTYPPFTQEAV